MTEEERNQKLESLEACIRFGEEAYDRMYEEHSSSGATGRYSDAKEAYYDAIRLAGELGLKDKTAELEKRLEHIKAVFRSQFT